MFDIGGGEILFIVFVVLLLFGPKKIPEVARMIKKGLFEIKKAQSTFQEQIIDIKEEVTKPINEIIEEPQKTTKNKPTKSYEEYENQKSKNVNNNEE